ncbi:membrane protein insertion efficiency factor YidD [Candidatus Poribacteria bacterium]|nr:membrane protein insertion efficiency factor YidD [Candidatus Poribacteria bacterium]
MQIGIRWLLLMPIRLHQKFITNQDGDNVCTFEPSCSHYGLEAIRRHGLQGLLMASNRLLRCYSGNHKYYSSFDAIAYDPVPPK